MPKNPNPTASVPKSVQTASTSEKNEAPPYPPSPWGITDESFIPFINEKRTLAQRSSPGYFVGSVVFLSFSTFYFPHFYFSTRLTFRASA